MSTPKPNAVDYVEIPSTDIRKTKAFFEALFGWRFTDYGPDYTSFEDGRISGGFYNAATTSSVAAGSVLVVIYAEHLEAMREKALGLGATVTRDIFSFPGGRRFQFAEPGGSEFAIWTDR